MLPLSGSAEDNDFLAPKHFQSNSLGLYLTPRWDLYHVNTSTTGNVVE